jgi:hypothetical protein
MLKKSIDQYLSQPASSVITLDYIKEPKFKGLNLRDLIVSIDLLSSEDLLDLFVDDYLNKARLSVTDSESLFPLYMALISDIEQDETYFDTEQVRDQLLDLKGFNESKVNSIIRKGIVKSYIGISRNQLISYCIHELHDSTISDYFQETNEHGLVYHSELDNYADMSKFFNNLVKFIKAS